MNEGARGEAAQLRSCQLERPSLAVSLVRFRHRPRVSMLSRILTMPGTRSRISRWTLLSRPKVQPGKSPASRFSRRERRDDGGASGRGGRKILKVRAQSARGASDPLVSPGDSAVPARSFALVREIMRGSTRARRGQTRLARREIRLSCPDGPSTGGK